METDRAVLDELRHGNTLSITAAPVNLRFAIVQPGKAKDALATCIADLKKAWGVDPDVRAATAAQLQGSSARYFSASTYPREASTKGIEGRVIALLNVTEQGAVAGCHVVKSAHEALDAGTCKAAMRLRFKPARDKDGTPLPSPYTLPVKWVLPSGPVD